MVPFGYDQLTIVEVEPGRRRVERSTMPSMRRWEHERTLTAVPVGTCVRDRVNFEPADARARSLGSAPVVPLPQPPTRGNSKSRSCVQTARARGPGITASGKFAAA